MYKEYRKAETIDNWFFDCILTVFFITLFYLTYEQAVNVGTGIYHSDILAYMQETLGQDSGYPFPYPIFFWLVKFFHLFVPVEIAISLVVASLNTLAMFIVKYYLSIYNDISFTGKYALLRRISLSLFVAGAFVASMFINPLHASLTGDTQYYVGVFTGNPWHNQTYLATRPFAIIAFFTFLNIIKNFEFRVNIKDFIIFSVSLLLTTMTKPSFTLAFVSAAGLYMVYRLLINRFGTIIPTLELGACFVPTFIELLRQYSGVFVTTETSGERGITFTLFEVWSEHQSNIPLAVIYANIFAIIVLLIFITELNDDIPYVFTFLFFVVSLLEAGFLAEKGSRFHDFNFCWGYMHGIFFFMLISGAKLIRATFREETENYKIVIGWLAFLVQVASGIFYLIRILNGAMYY